MSLGAAAQLSTDPQHAAAYFGRASDNREQQAIALFNLADAQRSGTTPTLPKHSTSSPWNWTTLSSTSSACSIWRCYTRSVVTMPTRSTFARCVGVCRERMQGATTHCPAYTLAIALLGLGEPESAPAAFESALKVNASADPVEAALLDIDVLQRSRSPIAGVELVLVRLKRALGEAVRLSTEEGSKRRAMVPGHRSHCADCRRAGTGKAGLLARKYAVVLFSRHPTLLAAPTAGEWAPEKQGFWQLRRT
jgi:hypothetical protein